jgi:glycosyltransferase involved in cell wall biosynthesis
MPIHNERDFIERSLGAVLGQDYPSEKLEVLVVDGMSTDGTREYVLSQPDPRVRLIDNPGKIVSKGLNLGISNAKGDIVVRVDGHTIISPDYIQCCVDTLMRTGADNVGGCMNAIGSSLFGRSVAIATSSPFGVGNARFHYSRKEEFVDTVYMGAWWKATLEKIGPFDEELVRDQDDEFNYRLRSRGGRILLSPSIHSEYYSRTTIRSLFSQYFQYGFWKVRVLQKHPRQMSLRQFVPATFVLGTGIGSFLLLVISWFWMITLPVAALYMSAGTFSALKSCIHRGLTHFPGVVLAFVILHVSYGAGFLSGLFRFRHRWQGSCDAKQGKEMQDGSSHDHASNETLRIT